MHYRLFSPSLPCIGNSACKFWQPSHGIYTVLSTRSCHCYAAASACRLLYSLYNDSEPDSYSYIPWSDELPEEDTVVVDCTHPRLPTLSHHRGSNNPAGLKPADTSTGIVLNALQNRSTWNRDVVVITHKRYVTTNHFDIDSFLSCWCYVNRKAALEHEGGRLQLGQSAGVSGLRLLEKRFGHSSRGL